jgi:predicted double-glycine peptidase
MRYEATVPQLKDFTCGAASLATVLTYYWGDRTTESDVLKALEGRYTKEEIQKKQTTGLSFDDLIYAAERLGFAGEGGQLPATELAKLHGPAIVRLKKSESFQHFVVLRKVGDGIFYLSDPVVGQVAQSSAEFQEQYTGDVLAIWRRGSPLPQAALLASPRDGISVSNSLARAINEPQLSPQKGL